MRRFINGRYNGVSDYQNVGVIAYVDFPYPWERIAIKPTLEPKTPIEKLLVCANACGYEAEIVNGADQEQWVRIRSEELGPQRFDLRCGDDHCKKLERLYESWRHYNLDGYWEVANWDMHIHIKCAERGIYDEYHMMALIDLVCAVMVKWRPKKT